MFFGVKVLLKYIYTKPILNGHARTNLSLRLYTDFTKDIFA